ncbi:UNVERIFIED_CONTAM: hypothetical protein Scaly_0099700 [Sesamum calycinum]|uniref:Uncharacterized protein n=1 Tax=Sesamum calycinum TaxID=2727403 RepID=A0AAW2SXE7_9LAMI
MWPWNTRKETVVYKVGALKEMNAEEASKKKALWRKILAPIHVIVHRLNVNPKIRPVKQKKRAFGNERIKTIKEEVEKLLRTDYIRPVQYPEWLANEREDQMSKEISGSWTQSWKVPTGSLKQ